MGNVYVCIKKVIDFIGFDYYWVMYLDVNSLSYVQGG